MSSLERLLSILDLYTEAEPVWTLEEIASEMGFTRSTTYRYVKELCDSGLLLSIGKGAHVLGPRIIEFDRQIRNCDPLVAAANDVLPARIGSRNPGLFLVCSLYGEKVLCIHQEPVISDFSVSYTRGRPMPLFYGATAKVILAYLPERRLSKLFLNHRLEISKAGLGDEWDEFRANLKAIRQAGYVVSRGEVDPGYYALGVPIIAGENKVIGSLTLVEHDRGQPFPDETIAEVTEAGHQLSERIGHILDDHDASISTHRPAIPARTANTNSK